MIHNSLDLSWKKLSLSLFGNFFSRDRILLFCKFMNCRWISGNKSILILFMYNCTHDIGTISQTVVCKLVISPTNGLDSVETSLKWSLNHLKMCFKLKFWLCCDENKRHDVLKNSMGFILSLFLFLEFSLFLHSSLFASTLSSLKCIVFHVIPKFCVTKIYFYRVLRLYSVHKYYMPIMIKSLFLMCVANLTYPSIFISVLHYISHLTT